MKPKKKRRFLNRPVKIGLGIAGIGASLEFGQANVYDLIQDPKLIFWLEVLKYSSYILGILFASGGVVRQAKEDLESIKLGEKVKDVVKTDIELKESKEDTIYKEKVNLENGFDAVIGMATGFFKKRRDKKAKKDE